MLPAALVALVEELARLPGVGPRTAERLAVYLLRSPKNQSVALAATLSGLHDGIRSCQICHNLSEGDICAVCADSSRDQNVMAVVEEALDVLALERAASFRGVYHVLGGVISPIDGIGPDQLNITSLIKRLKEGAFTEIIVATNPSAEGEATALYLQKQLPPKLKITRLARGLPMGSDLEYADQVTLMRALEGRQAL